METLKYPINWFTTTNLSNQAVVVIAILVLAYLMVYGFMKIKPLIPKIGAGGIWKLFLSIISVAIIFLICYEFYLLYINYYRSTPEQLTFKESSKNLAELELEPEKAILKYFGEKIDKKEMPTENEKRAAMEAEEKIRMVRKEYSEGKLAPPLQKIPAKPKEDIWDCIFEWEATAEQMASGKQKTVGLINEAVLTATPTDKVLKFKYKRPSGKLVELTLSRSDVGKFYRGKVSQEDLYLRVWLLPDDQNFKGHADNGPGTTSMEVFLKKKL